MSSYRDGCGDDWNYDLIQELIEHERSELIKKRLKEAKEEAPFGLEGCLFCDEPTNNKIKRWCDKECRDLWQQKLA